MEMLLSVLVLSLAGVLVSALLFAAAMPPGEQPKGAADHARAVRSARFFADDRSRGAAAVPIEVLLLQLERHVRLEQAAAESFHWSPTPQALHMHTVSPLVH